VIPFFVASSNGSKVELNFDFNHNNPIMQFVCPGGLPTYVAFVVDLSYIHVIAKEKESKLPPFKKPKKNYDILGKCWEVWGIQFPWGEMLKNETR
jgi:hypothetical protein